MASMQKEVRELVDEIRSYGFQVAVNGGTHAKIFRNGKVVVDPEEGGPLTLPTTPSDHRWYRNTVRKLIRARVLPHDPKRADQQGLTEADRTDRRARAEAAERRRQAKEARRSELRERAREEQALTDELRERLEDVLSPVNAWRPDSLPEAVEVAQVFWAKRGYAFDGDPLPSLRHIHAGGAETASRRAYWLRFLDDLESAQEPIKRYYDLLREARLATKEDEMTRGAIFNDPEIRQRQIERTKEMHARERTEREQITKKLKPRAIKLMKQIGLDVSGTVKRGATGWRGTFLEFGRVAREWFADTGKPGTYKGKPPWPSNSESGRGMKTVIFSTDELLDLPALKALDEFVTLLEQADDPKAKYEELRGYYDVRTVHEEPAPNAKKLREQKRPVRGQDQTEPPVEEEVQEMVDPQAVEPQETELPAPFAGVVVNGEQNGSHRHVSLEALALMARRAETNEELDRAIETAERILQLETSVR